ncbi:MAG: GlmL-related ornithine degradation protein [Clostridia bacterium]|nr:GlmL-related ornithine degradation protein [Clostridia bacterium]
MKIDALVAEIGSTTTVLNAFCGLGTNSPRFLGQGQAPTTVLDGDVRIGLNNALDNLKLKLNAPALEYSTMLATGSAAGGLRMSVHGLVNDMTVRAAKTAALGAGAIVVNSTSGKLTEFDLADLTALHPNLLLIAGGTDYGERETALFNVRAIADAGVKIPIIYCGNIQNHSAVKEICEKSSIPLSITDNVYPKLDVLNIEPVRKRIHEMFEQHIVKAPGMEQIRELVDGRILPTPGSVMMAAELLYSLLGDLLVLDIGGATTDAHSVSEGSPEIAQMQTSPEPVAKRTVEGDLGLFVNADNLAELIGRDKLSREIGFEYKTPPAIPLLPDEIKTAERLCLEAGITAVRRHAGQLRHLYTPQGRRTIAEGKDLTMIKHLVGTGGALTRLPNRAEILRKIADCNENRMMLFPKKGELNLLFDNDYIMASLGVLSLSFKKDAEKLLLGSLGL